MFERFKSNPEEIGAQQLQMVTDACIAFSQGEPGIVCDLAEGRYPDFVPPVEVDEALLVDTSDL